MLNLKTVQFVEKFDNNETKYDGLSASEMWEYLDLVRYKRGRNLSELEEDQLYNLLQSENNPENIKTVIDYVSWMLNNIPVDEDLQSSDFLEELYHHYIHGFISTNHFVQHPLAMVMVYEDIFRKSYVFSMIPIYVESLRMLLARRSSVSTDKIAA